MVVVGEAAIHCVDRLGMIQSFDEYSKSVLRQNMYSDPETPL